MNLQKPWWKKNSSTLNQFQLCKQNWRDVTCEVCRGVTACTVQLPLSDDVQSVVCSHLSGDLVLWARSDVYTTSSSFCLVRSLSAAAETTQTLWQKVNFLLLLHHNINNKTEICPPINQLSLFCQSVRKRQHHTDFSLSINQPDILLFVHAVLENDELSKQC